jgi:hypothetical protein
MRKLGTQRIPRGGCGGGRGQSASRSGGSCARAVIDWSGERSATLGADAAGPSELRSKATGENRLVESKESCRNSAFA